MLLLKKQKMTYILLEAQCANTTENLTMNKARHALMAVAFTLTALLFVNRIAISVAKGHIESDFGLTNTEFG